MAAKKQKYYVVWKGREPGVYRSWPETQAQVMAFEGALYKSYPTLSEARKAYAQGPSALQAGRKKDQRKGKRSRSEINWKSLSVDAACSGNPGPTEYQGVDTRTGDRIFHQSFPFGTNNIGEFLAIVHALALLKKQGLHQLPIYTDSRTAMKWVRDKRVNTKLERNAQSEGLYDLIERGEAWLKANTYRNPILKWDTESWGEIPADFGRK